MKTVMIIAIVVIVALLAMRDGGPRVTSIDRTVKREDEDDDA